MNNSLCDYSIVGMSSLPREVVAIILEKTGKPYLYLTISRGVLAAAQLVPGYEYWKLRVVRSMIALDDLPHTREAIVQPGSADSNPLQIYDNDGVFGDSVRFGKWFIGQVSPYFDSIYIYDHVKDACVRGGNTNVLSFLITLGYIYGITDIGRCIVREAANNNSIPLLTWIQVVVDIDGEDLVYIVSKAAENDHYDLLDYIFRHIIAGERILCMNHSRYLVVSSSMYVHIYENGYRQLYARIQVEGKK